jgi:nucleoside-diphosphate-sugar epimerase
MPAILVTGAAGFIGSHLCERLLDMGEEVLGVDCFTDYYDPALKRRNLAPVVGRSGFRLETIDLRMDAIEPILRDVDAVFHLAAQAGVRSSWGKEFHGYASHNIEATQRLLEACAGRERAMRRFVYASSSSVYGDAPRFPTREEDPKLPISPYGVTKLAGELLVRLYAVRSGLPATSLRYFTVYGPRQRPDMGFHRFLRAIHRGEEILVHGDGEQTRDFTYVGDAVAANIRALEGKVAPGAAFNVGGGSRVTLGHALELMGRVTGKHPVLRHGPEIPGDVRHTGADTTRAREDLGFLPAVGLAEGIERMNAWMTRYLAGEGE